MKNFVSMPIKVFLAILFMAILFGFPMRPLPAFGATVTHQMQVAATILDKGHCSFETPGPYLISFDPALDPLSAIERNSSVTFSVKCNGVGNKTSSVVVDRSGAEQLYLKKGSDSIPYSLNLPTSRPVENNKPVDITLTATIAENTYRHASPGLYSDTVTITVEP
jgi:spore coat protein U-like protein